jgi:hypothetical protein
MRNSQYFRKRTGLCARQITTIGGQT